MMTNPGTTAQEALYDLDQVEHHGDALRDLLWLREQTERAISQRVEGLRSEGASWAAVGTVLGVSAQAAHKRYAAA